MATEAPYIGYRSAGRRPERNNDREASANAPLAALRGMVSGVLGAPGDIESIVRLLPFLDKETVLPTSDDVAKRLPLREVSETPIGRAATFGGQIVGGTYTGPGSPLRAIAALPSAVRRAGQDFAMAAGQPAVNVVKQKGGNWLAGSIDDALRPLKPIASTGEMLQAAGVNRIDELNALPDEARKAAYERAIGPERAALNRWIDKKLGRYIQNEMATPEDPLRALIQERGISHIGMDDLQAGGWVPEEVVSYRRQAGFPEEGMAEALHASRGWPEGLSADRARAATGWEGSADSAIVPDAAGDFLSNSKILEQNPWLAKVPPETPVYSIDRFQLNDHVNFSHLIDELRNATNPESGLPRELLLKYSDLDKVTVPQAVERVAKINEWRAAQKVLADSARANNAATQVFKEYPDKGYKWVELTADKADEAKAKALADALKYEGETMGHCVGGYCPDVLEGRSRIYSLRDAKGQPHVTVEVGRSKPWNERSGVFYDNPELEDPWREFHNAMLDKGGASPNIQGFPSWLEQNKPEVMERYRSVFEPSPPPIVQIKGKANKAPKEDYLPFVQDFVRSGKWSDVGDLANTGLVEFTKRRQTIPKSVQGVIPRFDEMGIEGGYFTEDELAGIIKDWQTKSGKTGFAQGGSVNLKQLYGKYTPGYASGGYVDPMTQDIQQSYASLSAMGSQDALDRYLASTPYTAAQIAAALPQYSASNLQTAIDTAKQRYPDEGTWQPAARQEWGNYSQPMGGDPNTYNTLSPTSLSNYHMAQIGGYRGTYDEWASGLSQRQQEQKQQALAEHAANPDVVVGGNTSQSQLEALQNYQPYTPPAPSNPSTSGVGAYQPPSIYQPPVAQPGQGGAYAPPGLGSGSGVTGGLGGQQPYLPPSVYAPPAMNSGQGSFFPINYNPARIQDIVAHLQSQMYV